MSSSEEDEYYSSDEGGIDAIATADNEIISTAALENLEAPL